MESSVQFSRNVPVTIASAPALRAASACPGVWMPPPTMTGQETAFFTAEIIAGGTGLSAPEPASR